MKLLILLASVVFSHSVMADHLNGLQRKLIADGCKDDYQKLMSLREKGSENLDENSILPLEKKVTKCLMSMLGMIDAQGNLVIDEIKKKMSQLFESDPILGEKILKKCAIQKATPEETAHHFTVCSEELYPWGQLA